MKRVIPTYTSPAKGSIQNDIVGNSNDNFTEIFNKGVNYGKGIQRFLSKLRNQVNQKNTTIRIAWIGDSITEKWIASASSPASYFAARYPDLTFEYRNIAWGGTGSDYIVSGAIEVINFNPDLIVYGEWETLPSAELSETIFAMFNDLTSADVMLFPFTMSSGDMQFFVDNDMVSYKASNIYQVRKWWATMVQKYNFGYLDIHQPWMRTLLDGSESIATLSLDGLHVTDHAYTYTWETMDLAFSDNYDNEHLIYNESKEFKTIYLPDVIKLPDVTKIIKSGTWVNTQPTLDKTNWAIQSNQAGAYIETTFEGIGIELAHFGANIGVFDILINGVQPSTLLKDYAIMSGQYLHKVYKCIVNTNVLSNNDLDNTTANNLYLEFTSATEYKVMKSVNSTLVTTGNINSDNTFAWLAGSLTIPALYGGITNFRGTFVAGQIFGIAFYKNWKNQITQAADSLTTVTRLFGLPRGTHTLRLTVVSGTVNLDSIMELK